MGKCSVGVDTASFPGGLCGSTCPPSLPARSCVPHDLCPHTLCSHLLLTPLWPHLTLSGSRTASLWNVPLQPLHPCRVHIQVSPLGAEPHFDPVLLIHPLSYFLHSASLHCSHLTYSCVCLRGVCPSRWTRGLVYVIFACMFSAWTRVQHIVDMDNEKKNEWT